MAWMVTGRVVFSVIWEEELASKLCRRGEMREDELGSGVYAELSRTGAGLALSQPSHAPRGWLGQRSG